MTIKLLEIQVNVILFINKVLTIISKAYRKKTIKTI